MTDTKNGGSGSATGVATQTLLVNGESVKLQVKVRKEAIEKTGSNAIHAARSRNPAYLAAMSFAITGALPDLSEFTVSVQKFNELVREFDSWGLQQHAFPKLIRIQRLFWTSQHREALEFLVRSFPPLLEFAVCGSNLVKRIVRDDIERHSRATVSTFFLPDFDDLNAASTSKLDEHQWVTDLRGTETEFLSSMLSDKKMSDSKPDALTKPSTTAAATAASWIRLPDFLRPAPAARSYTTLPDGGGGASAPLAAPPSTTKINIPAPTSGVGVELSDVTASSRTAAASPDISSDNDSDNEDEPYATTKMSVSQRDAKIREDLARLYELRRGILYQSEKYLSCLNKIMFSSSCQDQVREMFAREGLLAQFQTVEPTCHRVKTIEGQQYCISNTVVNMFPIKQTIGLCLPTVESYGRNDGQITYPLAPGQCPRVDVKVKVLKMSVEVPFF